MNKIISLGENRKQRGLTEKGFEETRLLCLCRVVWEGFIDATGSTQPGEELRKDARYPGWGLLCQKNRKEGHVVGLWSGMGRGIRETGRGQILWSCGPIEGIWILF